MVNIGNDWDKILEGEFEKDYYLKLRKFLISEYRNHEIYPDMYDIFNTLKLTPYSKVKVVIIGQDPYHEPEQAHGLSFSVKKGVDVPPSLKNIYKELAQDREAFSAGQNFKIPSHGYLIEWAKQGVIMLNAVLTVRRGAANYHKGKGWEQFTNRVIELLNQRSEPMVFILWGANARAKKELITSPQHLVLEGAHPSPLSAHTGFFGGKYFSKTNEFLKAQGQEPVNWQISE